MLDRNRLQKYSLPLLLVWNLLFLAYNLVRYISYQFFLSRTKQQEFRNFLRAQKCEKILESIARKWKRKRPFAQRWNILFGRTQPRRSDLYSKELQEPHQGFFRRIRCRKARGYCIGQSRFVFRPTYFLLTLSLNLDGRHRQEYFHRRAFQSLSRSRIWCRNEKIRMELQYEYGIFTRGHQC